MGFLVLWIYSEIADAIANPEQEAAEEDRRQAARARKHRDALAKQEREEMRRHAAEVESARQREQERDRWIAAEVRRYKHRAHFENAEWLAAYAAKETTSLLERHEEILDKCEAYHEDAERIEVLKRLSPETYERAQWEMRALALAEQLSVEPLSVTPDPAPHRETHEEWLARHLRHRRTKATDAIARAEEMLTVIPKLDALNLDPDVRDKYLTAIEEAFAEPDPKEEAYNAQL